MAKNPGLNTSALFNLISPGSPFQPAQPAAPSDLGIALVASGSALSFSPSSLSFPVTTAGFSTNPLTTTLSNTGGSPANLGAITFAGANVADFTQTNSCPAVLGAGASCSIQVIATPAAQGARSATLLVSSSSIAAGSASLSLTDGGTSANAGPVTLSATTLNFTTVGAFQDLTLTNAGTTPLSFKSIATSNSSFTVSSNTCATVLPAHSSCIITLQTNSTYSNGGVDSTYYGTLTITDDAVAGPQTVSLFSSGTLTVQVPTFPNTAVGATSTAVQGSVVGTSHGDKADFQGTLTGANPGDFSPSLAGCVSTATPPSSQICYYSMTFSPSGPGLRTARFYSSSQGNGQYAVLRGMGTGSGSVFVASTPTLSGYLSTVSTPALTDTVTIQNLGSTTLSFSTFPIQGVDPRGFTVSGNCTSVAPGTSCVLTVRYSVTNPQAGTVIGTLVLTDATSGVSYSVPLSAVYSLPPAVITPRSYTFPAESVGTSATQSFTVADAQGNPLGQPVTISSPGTQAGSSFQVSSTMCPASTTAVCTFSVVYTASVAGNDGVSLQVNTTQLSVYGSGFYSSTPTLTASPSPLAFPNQALYTTSGSQAITFTNTGPDNSAVSLQAPTLGGASPTSFRLISNGCGSSLAHGASCQVMVAFAPTVTGSQSAVLTIASSAGSSPNSVTLTGTGF